MTIYWNLGPERLAQIAGRDGRPTAYRLAMLAGISQPAAAPIVHGAPVDRLDTATLEAVAKAFGVADPFVLLEHRED